MSDTYLCHIDELPESGCREFVQGDVRLFVVRQQQQLVVYLNQCPHIGTPLNWLPDKFLDAGGTYIQCSTHGALFEIASGRCIAGPCQGDSLVAIDYKIDQGKLFLI